MQTIQLVLSDADYAKTLKQLLADNGNWTVSIADAPVFNRGVVVLDEHMLAELSSGPDHPERVVLITRNDPAVLSRAWDMGIRSVVYNTDNSSTLLLAIMSAYLRLPKQTAAAPQRVISPSAPTLLRVVHPQSRSTRRHR